MDTQNVSAQLYFKQLTEDKASGNYNCKNTYPNLSTCVNDVNTDAQIENAFQDQLDLSEIYKSPVIFNRMKQEFMDKTMEAENKPVSNLKPLPQPVSVPQNIRVGPTDFLKRYTKEGFGSTKSNLIIIFIILAICSIMGYIYLNKSF